MAADDDAKEQAEEHQPDASVDDLAGALARQLRAYQAEDELLAEEHEKIKARRKWLKEEITKAERMTRSLLPRNQRGKKPDAPAAPEVNPSIEQQVIEQPVVQTQPVQAAAFKPE